jgi:hypothetical protein
MIFLQDFERFGCLNERGTEADEEEDEDERRAFEV